MRPGPYRYTFLLIALLALVLAPLLVGGSAGHSMVLGVVLLAVLWMALLAVIQHRKLRILVTLLAVLTTIAQIVSIVAPGTSPVWAFAAFAVFLSLVSTLIVRDVLRTDEVSWDKIQGAVCAYLLIGVVWAIAFAWIRWLDPQAFAGALAGDDAGRPMIYYSFVTLTTLGYGDITPVSQAARTLSWLEAAFGQIYLVVLVARLVSLHLTSSRRQ